MAFIRRAFDGLENQRKKRTSADIAVFFLLTAILVLFAPFIMLLITKTGQHFPLPNEFGISTLVILGGSWMIYKAKSYKLKDAFKQYWWSLVGILAAGLTFLIFQSMGWYTVLSVEKTQYTSIVKVLVVVHAVHFLVGLFLVASILLQTYRIKTSADFYIYFLNAKKNLFFILSMRYWEFLTFLWVFLYLLMLLQ